MKLKFIIPRPELQPYISKFWLFQDDTGFSGQGTLIAPNARCKIIIPISGSLMTTDHKETAVCHENSIFFIGIRDVPVELATTTGPTASLGIELTTEGAYQFIPLSMHELTNNLFSFSELFGYKGRQLITIMMNERDIRGKVSIIQDFLSNQLQHTNRTNLIVNYSVNFIRSLNGLAPIKMLEKKTGYTKRYLDLLFKEHLGISPKTFATIIRFQYFYKLIGQKWPVEPAEHSIFDFYHDQSHFIKEFKRYTGYTPGQYSILNNDFGKNF